MWRFLKQIITKYSVNLLCNRKYSIKLYLVMMLLITSNLTVYNVTMTIIRYQSRTLHRDMAHMVEDLMKEKTWTDQIIRKLSSRHNNLTALGNDTSWEKGRSDIANIDPRSSLPDLKDTSIGNVTTENIISKTNKRYYGELVKFCDKEATIRRNQPYFQQYKNSTFCSCLPPKLKGHMEPSVAYLQQLSWQHIDKLAITAGIDLGGHWKPTDCVARRRVTIIIPCRDRESQLRIFLAHTFPILQRQLIEFKVFVVEQKWPAIFNKAAMMNLAFLEAERIWKFDCVLFHDVDLLMDDDRNLVLCGDVPIHYGAYIDKFNYQVKYNSIFGGAVSLAPIVFRLINGYSNRFFGWGGEDDDFYNRLTSKDIRIIRQPAEFARYTSLVHDKDKANPYNRNAISGMRVQKAEQSLEEGLSTVAYDDLEVLQFPLYTLIKASLDVTKMEFKSEMLVFEYTSSPGECPGNTMRVLQVSPTTCQYQCDLDGACAGYVFTHIGGRDEQCELKLAMCDSPATINSNIVNRTAFTKLGVGNGTHHKHVYSETEGDCDGNDITGMRVELAQCRTACDSLSHCEGFVFGAEMAEACWLKSKCTPRNSPGRNLRTFIKGKRVTE